MNIRSANQRPFFISHLLSSCCYLNIVNGLESVQPMACPDTLPALLLRLREYRDAPAIIGGGDAATLSFIELSDAAESFAQRILSCGLPPGGAIGLIAPNSSAWVEAFFGISAVGGVVMPIDAQISDEDLRRMLAIGDCRLVIAAPEHIQRLRGLSPACKVLDIAAPLGAAGTIHTPMVSPGDTALLVFTSGTTGPPKAVPLSHANLLSNVGALMEAGIIGPKDHALVPLPFHHAYPLTVGMLTVLASGAAIVLPEGLSGPQLVEAMRNGEVTALLGVPRLYGVLLASLRAAIGRRKGLAARLFPALLALAGFAQRQLGLRLGYVLFRRARAEIGPKLRLMVSGGAALPFADEWALNALGWRVLTGYGLTETSPILTFNRPLHPRIGTAGQALPGVRLRIANPDPDGTGEIQATGSSVFSGYCKNQAATSAAFTPDGWFRTGDLGYLDADSYLHVTGRATETIILPNGKKIDPETLETLYAADPVIREIAVFGSATGLAALVVPDEQVLRESGTLRLHDRIADALLARSRTLAPHLHLGGFVITRTPLPRTPLGKLRRHLLQPLYARAARQGLPQATPPGANDLVPDDPRAAALWQWLRARYPDHPMDLATSPQLDLGLDSLGWIDLTLALQQAFGISLTEQQIARVITVGDLLREAMAAQANHPLASTGGNAEIWLAPYGPGLHIVRAAGEMLLRLVMRLVFRLKVEGRQHLPAPPFVICPNHASYMDAFALAAALPHRHLRHSYFAGWTGLLFATPLERLFSRAAQIIPVDPDRAVVASIADAAAVLRHGKTLVWFSEGRVSPDGDFGPFQPGIGAVLEQHPVPVVPAWIGGTAAALPLGRRLPRPNPVIVRFGPAINVAAIAPDLTGRARQHCIAGTIRQAVAALACANLREAGLARKEHRDP